MDIKETVKQKYGQIAVLNNTAECGCGCGCGDGTVGILMNDDYSAQQGYVPDADLSLGCGLPTQYLDVKEGATALDLGCGAGNDTFILSSIVGKSGRAIGLDMTPQMIEKAIENKRKTGIQNVEFVLGDIEKMPLENDTIDAVTSNCVINLVPDKRRAYSEIFRVLKSGGNFCFSDVVLEGELPKKFSDVVELYVGCVAGALQKDEYIEIIKNAGFERFEIVKEKRIETSRETLIKFISEEDLEEFSNFKILSITFKAYKP